MTTEITTTSENLPIPADRLAALRQKAARPIEEWQPVAGDALIGGLPIYLRVWADFLILWLFLYWVFQYPFS